MVAVVISYDDRRAQGVKGMSRSSLSVTQPLTAPRSLTGELVARLTDDITSGKIPPGSRLPTEQELIAAPRVSRTVVREAVAASSSRVKASVPSSRKTRAGRCASTSTRCHPCARSSM
jgi:hypothetical protein